MSTFDAQLGIAFQLADDLLGSWGDPGITGKPVFSNLRSRKKTLPVTYALTHGGAAGRELASWLTGLSSTSEARAADLIEAARARHGEATEARSRITVTEHALAGVPIPAGPRRELIAIAHFIVTRET